MSISRFNSPNFVSKLEPVKQVLLSGPSSLMYSNKPRALLNQSHSQIVGPTSVQPNSDKRTILKMIHDLPEENSPINETLRLLQEEFPLKTLSKKYQERFFFCKRRVTMVTSTWRPLEMLCTTENHREEFNTILQPL